MIKRMDHFTIVTEDVGATIAFYDKLGLKVGPRPDFPVPGCWLYAGDPDAGGAAILHVIGVAAGGMPSPRRGALDHMAYRGDNLPAVVAWLEESGVAYKLIRAPKPYRTWQIFFEDPNGVEVEIDFDPAEPGPPRPAAPKSSEG